MKILISAHTFYPNIGGIETFTDTLATEFTQLGHEVILITQTQSKHKDNYPYIIHRKPSIKKIFSLLKWCDVFYQSNISLKTAWPLLFIKKPWFITYHIWIAGGKNNTLRIRDHVKHFFARFAKNIAISEFIASTLKVTSKIIADPYNDHLFFKNENIQKSKELIFVGRLEPEKGCHVALQSLVFLQEKGYKPQLSIVGCGSQESYLRFLVKKLNLENQVTFIGPLRGQALAKAMQEHSIMLVPSVWQEPFGIVALEGIACGCVIIGSEGGGLKEPIGPCGLTIPNGNPNALATAIEKFLNNTVSLDLYTKHASTHLSQFSAKIIAQKYIEFFEETINNA